MKPIIYIDRITKKKCQESVYGAEFLRFLYGDTLASNILGAPLAHLLARIPLFSSFYGWRQNRKCSAKKIAPFIKNFDVDTTEFAKDPSLFVSFNDFFTRHLKPGTRPIDPNPTTAIIPADGRYLFYQNIKDVDGFVVKGKKFNLTELLKNEKLAKEYADGSMAIARLCPTDYHRYHFPCDCIPSQTHFINGWLYSVNPIAIKNNIDIFIENKRTLCILDSTHFDKVIYMEIGATCVGAIHETYTPEILTPKGAEKGFFSFGASSLILLFKKNTIRFDQDLLTHSTEHTEIKCLMGQSMGQSFY